MSKKANGWILVAGIVCVSCAAQATVRIKADNTNNLSLSTSWVGATVPGMFDIALWTNTVTGANAVQMGTNASYMGIWIVNPGGSVGIGGANILTNGFMGIDMSAATVGLNITNANFTLLDYVSQVWNVTNSQTLTVSPTVLTRNAGTSLGVQGAGTVVSANLTNDATGIIAPWVRYGTGTNMKYAAVSGGVITGYTGAAAATAANVTDTTGTANYEVAAAGTVGASAAFNTLRYTGAAGTIAGDFKANGLLNASPSGTLTLSGNVTVGSGKELVLTSPDTTRTIALSGSVGDSASGASSVTVTGGGRVNLTGNSSYSGVTVASSGILYVNKTNALGTTAGNTVIHVNGSSTTGAQLQIGGGITLAEPLTFVGTGDGSPWNTALYASGGTNTLTGPITIAMSAGVRITAGGLGTVLNINAPITRTGAGSTLILGGGGAGGALNVNVPINNNGGSVNLHSGPGTITFNVASNNIGDMNVQYLHLLRLGASNALGTNGNLLIGSVSTDTTAEQGTLDMLGFNQTVNGLNGNGTTVTAPGSTRMVTNSAVALSTLTLGNAGGGGVFNGVIGGNIALVKVGAGTQSFVGTNANTYTGLTTVNGGTLTLGKVAGTNAVPGNVVIGAGTLANGQSHQIPDAANVTLTAAASQWNLGGFSETVANVDVLNNANTGITTGGGGKLTVSGVLIKSGNITLNSGGSVIDANAITNMGGAWGFGIAGGDQGILVRSGGLTIGGGSTIDISATSTNRNYLSLGGDVTSLTNANANTIGKGAAPYLGQLKLNGARVFNVADGTAASDLTVSAIMVDGTGTGALTKTGLGTLTISGTNAYSGTTAVNEGTLALSGTLFGSSVTVASGATFTESVTGVITGTGVGFVSSGMTTLSGTNTYAGTTAVNAGVLSITATNTLPGWDTNGRYTVASGAALVIGNAVSNSAIATLLGTGNFAAGAGIGFDTTAGDRTYAPNLTDSGAGALGVAKVGANTLTLTGTNTYTGALAVYAGNLTIPYTNALPGWDTNGRYLVYSNAALVVGNAVSNAVIAAMLATTNFASGASIGFDTASGDRTYGSALSNTVNGALGLIKVSTNILTLAGTNTYDGSTTLNGGKIIVKNSAALGSAYGYTIVNRVGGTNSAMTDSTGQLLFDGSAGNLTLGENFILSGAEQYGYTGPLRNSSGNNVLNGWIQITALGARIGVDGGSLTLNGPVGRSAGVVNPMLVLNPNNGMLIVSNTIDIGTGLLNSHSAGTTFICSTSNTWSSLQCQYGNVLRIGANDALNTASKIYLGNPEPGNGQFDLYGYNQTLGGLSEYGTAASKLNNIITNSRPSISSTLTINQAAGVVDFFSGRLAGSLSLVKTGAANSVLTLAGTNTFTGMTTVSGGMLVLSNQVALQNSTLNITGGAVGFGGGLAAFTLGGLAGTQNLGLTNASGAAVALTVGNNNGDTTYSGALSAGGSLIKIGTGKLTLAGVNIYTGSTTISNGTLALGRANALGSGTQIILAGGTLDPGTYTNALSALTITSAGGTIALGDGSGALSFASSGGQTWSGTLNITGTWNPTSLRFGTDATGLTQTQLNSFNEDGHKVWVQQDSQGYLRKLTGTLLRLL